MAMCAAGPPNAVKPNFKNSHANALRWPFFTKSVYRREPRMRVPSLRFTPWNDMRNKSGFAACARASSRVMRLAATMARSA